MRAETKIITPKISSLGFLGFKPFKVSVEVDVKRGLPKFNIIGLAQNAVQEGKGRIGAALAHMGVNCAEHAITVNLMPAAVKKEGTVLDLAIAVAILNALGRVDMKHVQDTIFLGELSLKGEVLPIQGCVAAAMFAVENGYEKLVVSSENRMPLNYFKNDLTIEGVESLQDLIEVLAGSKKSYPLQSGFQCNQSQYQWSDIKGQDKVKRALQIAVAGEHNVLLLGPPGVGKSYMAKRLGSIYPKPKPEEQKDIIRIKSFMSSGHTHFSIDRPFQMPHHTSSLAGMVGGGRPFGMGEFTRAHKGILCLDEITEFRRDILESLREALDNHEIEVVRSEGHFTLPAEFMLVATSNLCPCGGRGENKSYCQCSFRSIQKYMDKISKPIRERIDMVIYIPKISWKDVNQLSKAKGSLVNSDQAIQCSIVEARKKQSLRYPVSGKSSNARVNSKLFWQKNGIEKNIHQQIETWTQKNLLSFRRVEKLVRVARSIADYENSQSIEMKHIHEAYYYQRWPEIN